MPGASDVPLRYESANNGGIITEVPMVNDNGPPAQNVTKYDAADDQQQPPISFKATEDYHVAMGVVYHPPPEPPAIWTDWILFGCGFIIPPLWIVGACLPLCRRPPRFPARRNKNGWRANVCGCVLLLILIIVAIVVGVVAGNKSSSSTPPYPTPTPTPTPTTTCGTYGFTCANSYQCCGSRYCSLSGRCTYPRGDSLLCGVSGSYCVYHDQCCGSLLCGSLGFCY